SQFSPARAQVGMTPWISARSVRQDTHARWRSVQVAGALRQVTPDGTSHSLRLDVSSRAPAAPKAPRHHDFDAGDAGPLTNTGLTHGLTRGDACGSTIWSCSVSARRSTPKG